MYLLYYHHFIVLFAFAMLIWITIFRKTGLLEHQYFGKESEPCLHLKPGIFVYVCFRSRSLFHSSCVFAWVRPHGLLLTYMLICSPSGYNIIGLWERWQSVHSLGPRVDSSIHVCAMVRIAGKRENRGGWGGGAPQSFLSFQNGILQLVCKCHWLPKAWQSLRSQSVVGRWLGPFLVSPEFFIGQPTQCTLK